MVDLYVQVCLPKKKKKKSQILWLVVCCHTLGPIQKIQVPFGFSELKLEYVCQGLPSKQPNSILVPIHFYF